MAGPRLPGPAGIASGGFQGGVPVRPESPQATNEFTDLAESLSSLSGTVARAGSAYHQDQLNTKVLTAEELRESAEKEAEAIKAKLAGYTAAQIGESLASEPMAAKFRENPYILPAVNIHRGRVSAGETFQQMIESGVNVRDPNAVNQYLKGNVGDISDPFLAAGFNEEWARRDAQLRSMQSQDALERADVDRANMGSTEFDAAWDDVIRSGGSVTDAAAASIAAVYNGEGVSGWEATDIVINKMRAAAVEGNVEMVEALANAPRGDAPPLAKDAKNSDAVATHLKNAQTAYKEKRSLVHVNARTALFDMIDAGATRAKLENSEEGKLLQAEDPEKWGQVVERERSEREQARAEADRRAIAQARIDAERSLVAQAAAMIADGRGEFVQSFNQVMEDGTTVSVSAASLKTDGMNALRAAAFPGGFEDIPDDQLPKLKQYTRKVADSALKDPLIENHLQGAGAYMNPESLVGNEKYVANAVKMYRSMDPSVAIQYVPDAKTRAVYASVDQLLTANPKLTVEQALSRAVARIAMPRVQDTPKNVRDAAALIRLQDHDNPNQGGLFGIGAGPNMVDVGDSPLYNELLDRTVEFQQYGMDAPSALAAASKEVEASYISVHGRAVRLPNDPKYPGETPQKWSTTVNLALRHAAATSGAGGEAKDYVISHAGGVVYTLLKPDGDVDFLTAVQIRELAAARAHGEEVLRQGARGRAAANAAKNN